MLTVIALSSILIQEPPAPPPPELRGHMRFVSADGPGLDADGDGEVTREEFAAPLDAAFVGMDKNGDGRLSAEELAGDHGPHRGPSGGGEVFMIRAPDTVGGHHITLHRSGPDTRRGSRNARDIETIFTGAPSGPDGRHEITVRTTKGETRIVRADGREGLGEGRIELRRVRGADGPGGMDLDDDGKVSEAEFLAPLREAFARMDADRSGFIDDGEREAEGGVHVFTHRL
ncbi:MAG: hypothetical protein EON96_19755, partial [Caulobacteraceae bacterium]